MKKPIYQVTLTRLALQSMQPRELTDHELQHVVNLHGVQYSKIEVCLPGGFSERNRVLERAYDHLQRNPLEPGQSKTFKIP